MKRINLYLLFLSLFGFGIASVQAAGGHFKLDAAHTDINDTASLQRGAKYFVNYCMGCHSAEYSRYNRVGADLGLTEEQVADNLIFSGARPGELMVSAMTTEQATAFFGAPAPDLTLVARSRGTDWLFTYLRAFYKDDSRPFGVNNLVFPSVSMPHVLMGLQGVQVLASESHDGHGDGHGDAHHVPSTADLELAEAGTLSPREYDRVARDLVNFMAYVAEPAQTTRTSLGFWVLSFLVLLFVVSYFMKREFWKDIH